MKPAIYKIMVLVVLLAIPAATLYAQSTGTRFVVPFQFTAGDKVMPAGDYFVECLWWDVVAFHPSKGDSGLLIMTQRIPRTQETKTRLIFHRYGDLYILASAELPNSDYGRTFPSEAVSHVIKVGGQVSQVQPEIVEIVGK